MGCRAGGGCSRQGDAENGAGMLAVGTGVSPAASLGGGTGMAELEVLPAVPSSVMSPGMERSIPVSFGAASLPKSRWSVSPGVTLASSTCLSSEPPAGQGTLCPLRLDGE